MNSRTINFLKHLKPRFVLYKGWVIDLPDIFLMALLLAAFLPILPSENSSTGFRVIGFKGSVENQYSLLIDAFDKNEETQNPSLAKLTRMIEADNIVDLEKTERSLEAKGLSKQASSCISRLFLTTDILLSDTELQKQIQSLAPSTVPAIWLLRLPVVGILTAISKPDFSKAKDATLSKCKEAGFAPVMMPLK